MAASYVFKLFIETFTDIYVNTVEKSNSGAKIDNLVCITCYVVLSILKSNNCYSNAIKI